MSQSVKERAAELGDRGATTVAACASNSSGRNAGCVSSPSMRCMRSVYDEVNLRPAAKSL
jgi:hypothetical protein